jgi:GT2 family glycosyltransferase
LVEDVGLSASSLGRYDVRVDDPVVLEGRRGNEFLSAHNLLDDAPDFAAAVTALNEMVRSLETKPVDREGIPDASIVIPIYGQLGYTLNCIESLITHVSRYSVELIIIDDCSPDRSQFFLPQVSGLRYHRQVRNGGFIASCNTGGKIARGRYIIMLNNDTRVVSGWLDSLIDSFTRFPNAGLVGSKMCYADGSLQEAGGIIWRDGTTWNYGRNDDPNRPQYSHARQVDYISGCSIALPKHVWDKAGGFDPLFTPAYCEDADLCLRIRYGGSEVWFQPQSRIVHYEGKTSGTDTTKGVKAYQVINTRKLYLRWREQLETRRPHGEAPYFERERGVHRRALVVDITVPTPNQDAGSVQTVLGLQVFREIGYKCHFVPGDNWNFSAEYTTELQASGAECAYAPYDLGFANYMRLYGRLFDVVLVYRVNMLERILEDIRTYAPQAALLFHVADLHFLRLQRQAELERADGAQEEAAAMKERELRLVNAVDCTITHSPVEAAILAEEAPEADVAVWPLMFDYFGTSASFSQRKDICFLGGYRHPPNVDAVRYFVSDIFPVLRAQDKDIRFIIAGANPTREVMELAGNGVVVLGLIEDLRDLFDAARVFVCPLRVGAGVKGKVLSALSYGLPVVSTSVGLEGSGLEEDVHALVADTPMQFVEKTLRVYNDSALWNQLSTNGQDLVQKEFSTKMGQRVLSHAIELGHKHRLGLTNTDGAPFQMRPSALGERNDLPA